MGYEVGQIVRWTWSMRKPLATVLEVDWDGESACNYLIFVFDNKISCWVDPLEIEKIDSLELS